MTREQIEKQVVEIVCNQLGVRKGTVTPEKYLRLDLGADMLDVVEIIMSLEDHFNIAIELDEADGLKTVGQIVEFVEAKGV